MKPHTRIYMNSFGYDTGSFIPSELSPSPAVDIHHIDSRGMGGTRVKDRIENLMALTRAEHEAYGDKKVHMAMLIIKHWGFMEKMNVVFDHYYIQEFLNKYLLCKVELT